MTYYSISALTNFALPEDNCDDKDRVHRTKFQRLSKGYLMRKILSLLLLACMASASYAAVICVDTSENPVRHRPIGVPAIIEIGGKDVHCPLHVSVPVAGLESGHSDARLILELRKVDLNAQNQPVCEYVRLVKAGASVSEHRVICL